MSGSVAQERNPHLTNAVIGDPRVHNQEWAKQMGQYLDFQSYTELLNGTVAT